MFFWNSLAFSMIQWMLTIWSLVPLPFLNPAWTSGSSWFKYYWSLSESESIRCSDMSDLCTPWTVTHQAPLGFSRQEYWSWLSFPSPGDLPNPRIEPGSPALQADPLSSEPQRKPNQRSNCQHPLNYRKSKRVPEKHLLLLYWLCQSLWLCGSQQPVKNS